LPARFQAQHIARHRLVAQLAGEFFDPIVIEIGANAIPDAQPPTRRHATASRKQVVSPHGLHHRVAPEHQHIHALGQWHLDHNRRRALPAVLRRVKLVR